MYCAAEKVIGTECRFFTASKLQRNSLTLATHKNGIPFEASSVNDGIEISHNHLMLTFFNYLNIMCAILKMAVFDIIFADVCDELISIIW